MIVIVWNIAEAYFRMNNHCNNEKKEKWTCNTCIFLWDIHLSGYKRILITDITKRPQTTMDFFPSSGHMIGGKRRQANGSKKQGSGTLNGGQRPRSGKWRLRTSKSCSGPDDTDGTLGQVVSDLDIFYFRRIAVSLQVLTTAWYPPRHDTAWAITVITKPKGSINVACWM